MSDANKKPIKKMSPEKAEEILPMIAVILKQFIDCDDVDIKLSYWPDEHDSE